VLLDEAHIARNPKTSTFKALKGSNMHSLAHKIGFKTKALFCITGTPIVNYPDDVRILSTLCTPSNPLTYGSVMQEILWKQQFLLRRTKEMLNIPSITHRDEWIEFSPQER
jgi:SNF2 family DNA or RNA helicase